MCEKHINAPAVHVYKNLRTHEEIDFCNICNDSFKEWLKKTEEGNVKRRERYSIAVDEPRKKSWFKRIFN